MLNELKRVHDTLADLMVELERLSLDRFDERAVAQVRWKLARESNKRRLLLETVIFPHVLSGASEAETRQISNLRREGAALRAESSAHIVEWTRERIAHDWAGYKSASQAIRTSMRQRIASERAILYPLLDRRPA